MLPRLLLVVLTTATVLGGCVYRDPLVHGPFMIGAERPQPGGPGCRPGDVRSQDVGSGWIENCAKAATPIPMTQPSAPATALAPTSLSAAPNPARSAWQ